MGNEESILMLCNMERLHQFPGTVFAQVACCKPYIGEPNDSGLVAACEPPFPFEETAPFFLISISIPCVLGTANCHYRSSYNTTMV